MNKNYLVLDVGTSGVKAIVFNSEFKIVGRSYVEMGKNITLGGAGVEQDPEEIYEVSVKVLQEAVKASGLSAEDFVGLGITNQRETIIAWDEAGKPIYPAIVWQDTRTAAHCGRVPPAQRAMIRERTGLANDPYFSASKISWLLEKFSSQTFKVGTVDSWLLYKLVENNPHITDVTNASRTLLWNIKNGIWDKELLEVWQVPENILPKVLPSKSNFGKLKEEVLGFSLPVLAVCGDQQASFHAASVRGANTKITFGTGIFMVQEISEFKIVPGFFTTVLPSGLPPACAGMAQAGGELRYGIEAKVAESCGPRVLPHLGKPTELKPLMKEFAEDSVKAINKLPKRPTKLVVDGGVTQSELLMNFLREFLPDIEIIRQEPYDGTALGVAFLLA
jgi:glycerol kinase